MSFQDYILSILSSAAVSGALVAALIWLSREWMSTRIKGSIQYEYDQKLEAHKSQLKAENEVSFLELKSSIEREAALHAVSHASFSEGQKAAMERKLNAVDKLWGKIINLRSNLPLVLTYIEQLTVDEYKEAKNHPSFQAMSGDSSLEKIASTIDKEEEPIESVRPYIGEYMWAIFSSYQAIMDRLLVLLNLGRNDAEKIEWYKDPRTRQVIEAVLTKKELEEFDSRKFGKVTWIQRQLESKILSATSKVISGEAFGEESLKQAKLIQQLAIQLQDNAKKALHPTKKRPTVSSSEL